MTTMTDFERRHAIRDGEQNAASESYFTARPQIDTNDRHKVFQAGFERGWDGHDAQVEALSAAQAGAPAGYNSGVQTNDKVSLFFNDTPSATAWFESFMDACDRAAAPQPNPSPAPARVNTKTHDLLSTMIGLFLGAKDKIGYKPGSVIDKVVAEAVEHLKDWPYPEPAPAQPGQEGEFTEYQILAITTAYEQGVGKGRQAYTSGNEIANPYSTGYRCDLAWQYGYEEGKEQAERIETDRAARAAPQPATAASEWDVRGRLAASLTCWHRLTGKEADELVAMFKGRSAQAILAADHQGMRVDYSGLLGQCQRALRGREPANAEMLRQLQGHLQELGQRWYGGDTAVVDEILQLYCVEHEARQALKGGA